jgi:hypothetical protein
MLENGGEYSVLQDRLLLTTFIQKSLPCSQKSFDETIDRMNMIYRVKVKPLRSFAVLFIQPILSKKSLFS